MMKLPKGFSKLDIADLLENEEEIQAFLKVAMEHNDPAHMAHALGVAARARGISEVAKQTGLTRAAIYRAFSKEGNPRLDTLFKVTEALGLRLTFARA